MTLWQAILISMLLVPPTENKVPVNSLLYLRTGIRERVWLVF